MKNTKSIECFFLFVLMLFVRQSYAQNGWTSCGNTAGLLSGNTKNLIINDTTSAAVFITVPTGSLPQTEFLVILKDSLASGGLGDIIISSSSDGRISPMDLGLSVGDTISIIALSYDLQDIQNMAEGILHNSVIFVGSCCSIIDLNAPSTGICTALNTAGIQNGSDITNARGFVDFVAAFDGGGSCSIQRLKNILEGIENSSFSTLATIGCTNGVGGDICYALDSIPSNHDHYAIVASTGITILKENQSMLRATVHPNPFTSELCIKIMTKKTEQHHVCVFNVQGQLVYQERVELLAGEQLRRVIFSDLPSGVYYLKLSNSSHLITEKMIKS